MYFCRFLSLAVIIMILGACSRDLSEQGPQGSAHRPANVPPDIAGLATDALRAAAEVKVGGDIDAVLRAHPLSPRFSVAMREHFELMQRLHRVGLQSRLRYPRYSVAVRHDQFCEDGRTAKLVVTAIVRYDMEMDPPNTSAPPYTAAQEEHVFGLERRNGGQWMIVKHHEIGLGEMHQRDVVRRLRNPCL